MRRISELEDLDHRADDRVVEIAVKIQQRSQELYFLEKKHGSVVVEVDQQRDVNIALQDKTLEEPQEQEDLLEEKSYLLEEEMGKAQPIRNELIVLKGARQPSSKRAITVLRAQKKEPLPALDAPKMLAGEEDKAQKDVQQSLKELLRLVPNNKARMESLIEQFEAEVSHKEETTAAAKRLNGELTGHGMTRELVQQEVRHLTQYRVNSIFRIFKLKAEYRLLEKKWAKKKAGMMAM